MTPEKAEVDLVGGFVAATCTPAVIVGALALPLAGPLAIFIMFYVLIIALLHVMLLAIPIYALVSRLWQPGPMTVLIAATLIGVLPISLLFSGHITLEAWPFAIFGFFSGCAFLGFAYRGRVGEGY